MLWNSFLIDSLHNYFVFKIMSFALWSVQFQTSISH